MYSIPQSDGLAPDFGFSLKPKNNFADLLHDPDVVGPWYGGGKGTGEKKGKNYRSLPIKP